MQGWPNENWLLVTAANQTVILPLMQARLASWCQAKGFDAVEPDNLDGFSNITQITEADNVAYDLAIAGQAHGLSLSIGMKNLLPSLDASYVAGAVAAFDWALVEQCYEYGECASYTQSGSFIALGKAVWDVEYNVAPTCASADSAHLNAQKRDLEPRGPDGQRLHVHAVHPGLAVDLVSASCPASGLRPHHLERDGPVLRATVLGARRRDGPRGAVPSGDEAGPVDAARHEPREGRRGRATSLSFCASGSSEDAWPWTSSSTMSLRCSPSAVTMSSRTGAVSGRSFACARANATRASTFTSLGETMMPTKTWQPVAARVGVGGARVVGARVDRVRDAVAVVVGVGRHLRRGRRRRGRDAGFGDSCAAWATGAGDAVAAAGGDDPAHPASAPATIAAKSGRPDASRRMRTHAVFAPAEPRRARASSSVAPVQSSTSFSQAEQCRPPGAAPISSQRASHA